MNRLILVGNGFDLAHGLKTSYKDFIIWYLVDCFSNVGYHPKVYEDTLLKIEFNDRDSFISIVNARKPGSFNINITKDDLTNFISNCFEEQTIKELLNINDHAVPDFIIVNSNEIYDVDSFPKKPFAVFVLSEFLKSLIINCQDCNWVDIENEYFNQLKACKAKDNKFDIEKVIKLNSEFAYLKTKLEKYLQLQQEQVKIKANLELVNSINANFNIADFEPIMGYENAKAAIGYDKTIKPEIFHKLYFLNFNYTNTVKAYVNHLYTIGTDFSKIDINYIHGQLNDADNPIIFGFGDEHDKNYLEFEEYHNNVLFDHIKSFQYLRTPHYRNLLKFLNRDNYQVFVMGHSCGLSDRTMFKEIFEHENCKSIRLFHYNGDFHDKVINVSKHFSNKGLMRKLIVDYKSSDAFPQSAQS